MHIKHSPFVELPDSESNTSENASEKIKRTDRFHHQNQIGQINEEQRHEVSRRRRQLERKSAIEAIYNNYAGDEAKKDLKLSAKEKLLRILQKRSNVHKDKKQEDSDSEKQDKHHEKEDKQQEETENDKIDSDKSIRKGEKGRIGIKKASQFKG